MQLSAAGPWHARRSCGVTAAGSLSLAARALAEVPMLLAAEVAFAQTQQPRPRTVAPQQQALQQQQAQRLRFNQDALILAASRPGTSYLAMATDLVAAGGAGGSLRVLPIAASGGLANLQDLLFLRGVDMAIVPANVLVHAKATNAFGGSLSQRVAYVTVLYGEEVHVLVGRDIASLDALRGKRIAVPPEDGTAQFTASDIFQRLGVSVESVVMEPVDALEGVRAGTLAAAVLVAGKPFPLVSGLPKDGSVRLLQLPFSAALGEGYSPAVLMAEDYPALIPPGAIVETVAVSAVLLAKSDKTNDEAARRVAKHVPAVLDAISKLAVSERHPKWKDVNLGAVLPGWSRVAAAEAWLIKAFEQQKTQLQGHFDEFLRASKQAAPPGLSAAQRKKLFDEFQGWARKSVTDRPDAK